MKLNEYQARVVNSIAESTPGKDYFQVINALKKLRRYATTLHRLDENACNGWPRRQVERRDGKVYVYDVTDENWQRRDELKEKRTEERAEKLAKEMGWSFERQGDPRGFPFYILITARDGRQMSVADVIA